MNTLTQQVNKSIEKLKPGQQITLNKWAYLQLTDLVEIHGAKWVVVKWVPCTDYIVIEPYSE
jgi:hypothetical protein